MQSDTAQQTTNNLSACAGFFDQLDSRLRGNDGANELLKFMLIDAATRRLSRRK